MSSDYRILCLSHDPAIVVAEPEWQKPEPALAAVAHPETVEGLEVHTGCDLLVGRFSYPLVEVGCPGFGGSDDGLPVHAHQPHWLRVEWLLLLHAALRAPADLALTAALAGIPRCWSAQRVRRLRLELGVGEGGRT